MKLKDWVTLGNLLCGFASVIALFHHEFKWASYLILFGYVFDALDGVVARLTKQFNKFGGELDALCDFITYSIAPSYLVYYAFYHHAGYPLWAAVFIGFVPTAAGAVRAARYNVRRAEFPGFFIGLPRTAFALLVIALLNSSLFNYLGRYVSEYLYLIPLGMILVITWFLLSLKPFVGHHDHDWGGWIIFGMWWFLISIPVGLLGGWLLFDDPGLVFDALLFDLIVYTCLADYVIPKDKLSAVRAYVKEWDAMGD